MPNGGQERGEERERQLGNGLRINFRCPKEKTVYTTKYIYLLGGVEQKRKKGAYNKKTEASKRQQEKGDRFGTSHTWGEAEISTGPNLRTKAKRNTDSRPLGRK